MLMTQSIAYDRDLEYSKKDLIRYYQDFDGRAEGDLLEKGQRNGEKIYFAKSWAYSAFRRSFCPGLRATTASSSSMPSSSFFSCLWASPISLWPTAPALSLLRVLTFLFASVAGVYFLWISPDFFNFCLVFAVALPLAL